MIPERRQDIGSKVLNAVIGALVGIVMTMTWFQARDAICMAQDNKVQIAVNKTTIEESFKSVMLRLSSIDRTLEKLVDRNVRP